MITSVTTILTDLPAIHGDHAGGREIVDTYVRGLCQNVNMTGLSECKFSII